MESKRRKISSLSTRNQDVDSFLDAISYMQVILNSLGYNDVSNSVKEEFASFIHQWIEDLSKTVTVGEQTIILFEVVLNHLYNIVFTSVLSKTLDCISTISFIQKKIRSNEFKEKE